MDSNGFSGVKIIGYEHNWNDAGGYPITLVCEVFYLSNVLPATSQCDGRTRDVSAADAGYGYRCKTPRTRSQAFRSTAIQAPSASKTRSTVHILLRRYTSPSALVHRAATGGATSRCVADSVLPPVSISYTFVLSGTWTTCELASTSRSDTCPAPFLTTRRDTDLSARSNTTRTMG